MEMVKLDDWLKEIARQVREEDKDVGTVYYPDGVPCTWQLHYFPGPGECGSDEGERNVRLEIAEYLDEGYMQGEFPEYYVELEDWD